MKRQRKRLASRTVVCSVCFPRLLRLVLDILVYAVRSQHLITGLVGISDHYIQLCRNFTTLKACTAFGSARAVRYGRLLQCSQFHGFSQPSLKDSDKKTWRNWLRLSRKTLGVKHATTARIRSHAVRHLPAERHAQEGNESSSHRSQQYVGIYLVSYSIGISHNCGEIMCYMWAAHLLVY